MKVLVEGGRKQDSNITRLYGYRERMPVFALAYLNDALVAKGEGGGVRSTELKRRIGNAILPEAATAHVEEMNDPVPALVLELERPLDRDRAELAGQGRRSPTRSTAAWSRGCSRSARTAAGATPRRTRWRSRRWSRYYRKLRVDRRRTSPRSRQLGRARRSRRRSSRAARPRRKATDVPMAKLLASAPAGTEQPLTFTRTGAGTLFYSARLRYAVDRLFQQGSDQGIRIERAYAPYVETGTRPAATSFKAGDLVRVTLTLQLTKERRFVAVTDPLPAGFEPVESWFATSAAVARAGDRTQRAELGRLDRRGGSAAASITSSATTIASSCSPRASAKAATPSPTSSARRRRARSARRRRTRRRCTQPEVFGRTATAVIESQK